MQTLDLDVDLSEDDYGQCVAAIMHQGVTGLDAKWVGGYWNRDEMKRECWDTTRLSLQKFEFTWSSSAVDPYEFVYEGLD
jgi:hypothetical protein